MEAGPAMDKAAKAIAIAIATVEVIVVAAAAVVAAAIILRIPFTSNPVVIARYW